MGFAYVTVQRLCLSFAFAETETCDGRFSPASFPNVS
jgi:hypothetical protein